MKSISDVHRILLLMTCLLLQQSMYAEAKRDSASLHIVSSKQTAAVRSFTENGVKYAAIRDLAEMLKLDYFENRVLAKAELRLEKSTLKFSEGNSFVVQINPKTNRFRVFQLHQPTLIDQQLYFAPAREVVALLKTLDDSLLSIEEDKTLSTKTEIESTAVAVVQGFTIEEKKNGSLVRIRMTGKAHDAKSSLQIGDWLYVTLPAVHGDTVKLDTAFSRGIIRHIKPVQSETSLQLSLQIRGKIETSELVQDQQSNDMLLTLIPPAPEVKKEANADSIKRAQDLEKAKRQVVSDIQKQKKKWKLDVIVLDAGHGGHDPGAIGTIGTREKDVTLGVSLKLGALIEKEMPDVKVVYTRKTDRFIELYRRGQMANENEGKLFVSIHCNSVERKSPKATGFEIYLLRPGKTEDAIHVAEKENAVVKLEKDYEERYQDLNEENFIILTMAQSAYVKQSERFAELLEETMSAEMESQRQAVKQAGFYVLVGASMPNVLVETGYLSNPKEEKFLRSPAGQKKIAEAILNAIKGFKREYEQENN
ncbi:MAG: N-acetylmuramoyl-L-alanine amidase [Bacteroidota bacterium]|nr:N-acetylmuramoyl-L-alanine amidase [Bacteroidota bacterium]